MGWTPIIATIMPIMAMRTTATSTVTNTAQGIIITGHTGRVTIITARRPARSSSLPPCC